jgi:hypothetical protein
MFFVLRASIFPSQRFNQLNAAIKKPAQFPGSPFRESIGDNDRHGNRGIQIGHNCLRKPVWVDFTPAYRFGGCGSGEIPCVRACICDLKIIRLKVTIHERDDTYVSRDGCGGNGRSP